MSGGMLRRRNGLLAIVAAVLAGIAVAGFAAWFLLFRDVAEPTTVGEAVTSFRNDTDRAPGTSPVPAGVYVYATDGFEKTDALTGVTHRYPPRSTITVTKDPCGVRMRWDVLKGRSTTWTFCIGASGWSVASQDERHTFFGNTERTTYVCSNAPLRPAGDAPGTTLPIACATSSAEERGTERVVGRVAVPVGTKAVEAVHLRKTSSFTGEIRGSSKYDFWLDRKSGVPVSITMVSRTTNDSPVGDVHYDEVVTLRLISLTPRR
jgi:hypothetical protein